MKIIKKNLKDGILVLKPEDNDDLWSLSKVIKKGDLVSASTTRKIEVGNEKVRKKVFLKIRVEKVHFENNNLRVSGVILESNSDDVPLGNYHSINVEPGTMIKVEKEDWLKHELEELNYSLTKPYKILVCIFDREEALFALITKRGYEVLRKIKGEVIKKDYETKQKGNFFKELKKQILDYYDRIKPDSIILATQGFWKDYLMKELEEGTRYDELKNRLVIASCSGVSESSIRELLHRPETRTALKKTRLLLEEEVVGEVMKEILKGGLVVYGLESVKKAVDYGAVKKLIVSDSFIREHEDEFNRISEVVNKQDGELMIIDSNFEPGKKINGLGGIVAFLRFRID